MQFRRMHNTARRKAGGRQRFRGVVFCCGLLAAMPGLLSAGTTTFLYDAFLSGVPVGTATLTIIRDERSYRIAGTASAGGVAHLVSNWRSDFHAFGRVEKGKPLLVSYAYDERERTKQRVLWLHDGLVRQVKNDQVRASFPALAGTDVLTAFFIDPGCWTDRLLHTGRFNYRIQGRPAKEADACRFEIIDDDGERLRVDILFDNHEGLRVPVRVSSRGLLRGSIRLRQASQPLLIARQPED